MSGIDTIGRLRKIDEAAVNGLNGVNNSLAYKVHEIERHFHGRERWWGALAGPTETNAIEANVDRPFVAISGDDAWGTAIPILGTGDDPGIDSDTKVDIHRFLITDLDDDTTPWRLRIIWGTGTSGDAITAGDWSEVMTESNAVPGNRAGGTPINFMMPRLDIGGKCWAQSWNDTNLEEMSFFFGSHSYPA